MSERPIAAAAVARAITAAADEQVLKSRRATFGRTAHSRYDILVTDRYTPLVEAALAQLWTQQELRDAIRIARIMAPSPSTPTVKRVDTHEEANTALISGAVTGSLAYSTPRTQPLRTVLSALYSDAWLVGAHVGAQQTGVPLQGAAGDADASMDWSTWEPGTSAPAVVPPALTALLSQLPRYLAGIVSTTAGYIGNRIAKGILAGLNDYAVLTSVLDLLHGSDWRARMISQTETNRSMMSATRAAYAEAGVTAWDWVAFPGCCDLCISEATQNPHAWDDDDIPPAHRNCRCTTEPAESREPR